MDIYENLNRYRIFLCVAQSESISRAAQKLYISQPAVSSVIKKLEESLGTVLFLRKSRGVVLTDNGRLLYSKVLQAFEMLDDAESSLKNLHSSGRIKIAASNVLCKYMLMPYLQSFTEQYPSVDVTIKCTSSAEAIRLLEDGGTDIALAAKPANISGFSYHRLGVIEDIFVCTPNYLDKLACSGNDVFERGSIMLLNKDNVSREHIDNYYASNKINPSRILEVNDMDLLIAFAKMGIGISCVVKQFVREELKNASLVEVVLPSPIISREAGFLYNSGMEKDNDNILKLINAI